MIRLFIRALTLCGLAAAVFALLASQAAAQGTTVTFVSDLSWQAFAVDPVTPGATPMGGAQNVCPNASNPPTCPSGALLYGFPGTAWVADLSAIPGATWIWAPGITAATAPAELAEFYFMKTLEVPGTPTAGVLRVAADDFAEVRVNGAVVGTTGSTTDVSLAGASQSALRSFDITPFLTAGANTITIRAGNGIGAFAGGCSNCTYSQHPAGVVVGGSITAADSTPPTLTLPADITVEATGPDGTAINYAATATDDTDPSPVVGCQPPSGSTFALGTTSVACTATDASGNSSSGSFNVSVVDTTPPVMTLPADMAEDATSPAGAVVSYATSASDLVDPAPIVTCAPASGTVFPIGTTTVACTATDASGNSVSGGFSIHLRGAQEQLLRLIELIESFNVRQGIENSLDAKLQNARKALESARAGDAASACGMLESFLNEIEAQRDKALTSEQADRMVADGRRIKAVIGCT